jgi:competence protein ComEC
LYGILFLLVCSGLPYVGDVVGLCINWALWLMNKIIQGFSSLPFTVWDNIPATFATTFFLYLVVCFTCLWLLHNNKKYVYAALLALLVFVCIHTINNWQVKNQQKLIVYNVPQKQAIDFVVGNQYQFKGDSALLEDGMLQNFHLKPGRIALQLNKRVLVNNMVQAHYPFYQFGNKKILLLDSSIAFEPTVNKITIDVVIVSNNPSFNATQLIQTFNCKQIVFDASNSVWKIDKWQTACSEVHLSSYSIPKQGAFVWDIQ